MRPLKPRGLCKDFVLVSGMPGEVYVGITGLIHASEGCSVYWIQTGGQEGVRSEHGDLTRLMQ